MASLTLRVTLQQPRQRICSHLDSDIPEKHVFTSSTSAAPAAVRKEPHSAAVHSIAFSCRVTKKQAPRGRPVNACSGLARCWRSPTTLAFQLGLASSAVPTYQSRPGAAARRAYDAARPGTRARARSMVDAQSDLLVYYVSDVAPTPMWPTPCGTHPMWPTPCGTRPVWHPDVALPMWRNLARFRHIGGHCATARIHPDGKHVRSSGPLSPV